MLSVIMPVCNGAEFLREAIMSIGPLDSIPTEIIVIDDASTDETGQLVREMARGRSEVQYVRLPENVGPGSARNRGLEIANGDLVGFLDADDRYAPNGLQRLCAHLRKHSGTDAVMGTVCTLRRTEDPSSNRQFDLIGERARAFQLGSVVARRRVFDRFGVFDPAYRHGEDIDWFLRIQEGQARVDQIDDLVLHHRRHGQNMSIVEPQGVSDIAMVMHASLRRREKLAAERNVGLEDIYFIKPERIPDASS